MIANALFSIAGLVVVYGLARLAGLASRIAAGVSFTICAAFAIGSLLHPFAISEPPIEPGSYAGSAAIVARSHHSALTPNALRALKPSKNAAFGSIDSLMMLPSESAALVSGWIADGATRGPVQTPIILIDGHPRYDATAEYGQPRPDVAKALGLLPATNTGFAAIRISLSGLSRGTHVIGCAALASGGTYDIVASTKTLTVN